MKKKETSLHCLLEKQSVLLDFLISSKKNSFIQKKKKVSTKKGQPALSGALWDNQYGLN